MTLTLDRTIWTRVRLGDVVHQSKENVDPADGAVKRYVAGEHMDTSELRITRWGVVGHGYLGPAFHRRFRPGQILYGSRRTYLRKVAVADFDGVCANTTFVLEPKDQGTLSPDFLPFVMSAERFHEFAIAASRGSVNPYVNWSDIARYEFDLPPLDEQHRVASLLWALEDATNDVEKFRHRCVGLLTARAEALVWDGNYALRSMSEVLDSCNYGTSERCIRVEDGGITPVLRIPNVLGGALSLDDLKYLPEPREPNDKAAVQPGDLLIVRTNGNPQYVSRGALVPELDQTYLCASYLLRLRPHTARILPEYLALAWETPSMKRLLAAEIKSSAGNYNLSAKSVMTTLLPIPDIPRQAQIVRDLRQVQVSVDGSSRERDALRDLRRALIAQIWEASE